MRFAGSFPVSELGKRQGVQSITQTYSEEPHVSHQLHFCRQKLADVGALHPLLLEIGRAVGGVAGSP